MKSRRSSAPSKFSKLALNKDMDDMAKEFAYLRHAVRVAENMNFHDDPEEAVDEVLVDAIFHSQEAIMTIHEMRKKLKKYLRDNWKKV